MLHQRVTSEIEAISAIAAIRGSVTTATAAQGLLCRHRGRATVDDKRTIAAGAPTPGRGTGPAVATGNQGSRGDILPQVAVPATTTATTGRAGRVAAISARSARGIVDR
ncbi:MAG: hypothetical protein C0462_08435, partial [Alcanivorax sp.]|nr:hypothetical protein [Alcanivorax sp.]